MGANKQSSTNSQVQTEAHPVVLQWVSVLPGVLNANNLNQKGMFRRPQIQDI